MSLAPSNRVQKNILKYLLGDIWKIVHTYMQYEDAQIFFDNFYTVINLVVPIRPTFIQEIGSVPSIQRNKEHNLNNIENYYLDKMNFVDYYRAVECLKTICGFSYGANIHYLCKICNNYTKLKFNIKDDEPFLVFHVKHISEGHDDTWLCDCCNTPGETSSVGHYPYTFLIPYL